MSIWLFRAGRNGEYESKFLEDKRIYLTWDGLNVDLSGYQDRDKLLQRGEYQDLLSAVYIHMPMERKIMLMLPD